MAVTREDFLSNLIKKAGSLSRFEGSRSLFKIDGTDVVIYIRYSKVHGKGKTFYGLREKDLEKLESFPSLICLLWEGQKEPLLIPYQDFEEVFQTLTPASDGQYKCQVLFESEGIELYIARAGRFNVEGFSGWHMLEDSIAQKSPEQIPQLSHGQVQTLQGGIGNTKGFDIWIPAYDRGKLDWGLTSEFTIRENAFLGLDDVKSILQEVDVVWLERGSSRIRALFEVEHSTTIYSGLLRFNDFLLFSQASGTKYSIVSNETRRGLFVRQVNRPTFVTSGLSDRCTFLEYLNVYKWHQRLSN